MAVYFAHSGKATPARTLLKQQRMHRRMFPRWKADPSHGKMGPFKDQCGNLKFLRREDL